MVAEVLYAITMRKILVTGANGFVGQHLVRELSEQGITVIGVGGPIGTSKKSPYIATYFELDLRRADEVARLEFNDIDGVIHLAGLAVLGSSFDDPMRYMNTNVGIEVNMFEAALAQHANPRFIIVSSGALYDPSAHLPLTETSSVLPGSPYAVSKIGQEEMARYYSSRGFESIIARPFNHIGPGQGPGLIVPDLAQQVVAVAQNKTSEVKVGNLDAKRDYTDVRDIARAYRLLLEKGRPGEIYNICSGTPRSGHDILSGLTKAAGVDPKVIEDSAKLRPSDNPLLYGDHSKITADTGWQPEIPIETTLADVIADWQSKT
jgi:GDP-4-dehydro-6-deoxy-D-mannose reductase